MGRRCKTRVVEGVGIEEAIDITRQIGMALDHRPPPGDLAPDLKPENVMLTQMTDGSLLVKVLDFGIARIFQDDEKGSPEQQNRLTQAGEVFGTPAYISPEQARGERELTPASDLYSLGVMLFEMLQGELPFWGDTAIDTIMLHISSPVPPIQRLDVPAPLKQLVYDLLDKDPSQRPQSGRELTERLNALDQLQREPVAVGAHNPAHQTSASMGMGAPHAPSPGGARSPSSLSREFPLRGQGQQTLPEMGPKEIAEWSRAEATVVGTHPPSFDTYPPHRPLEPPRRSPRTGPSSSSSSLTPRAAEQDTMFDPAPTGSYHDGRRGAGAPSGSYPPSR